MTASPNASAIIKYYEQSNKCALKAYLDTSGIPTIGWGEAIMMNGVKVHLGQTCTLEQADKRLQERIVEKTKYINTYVKSKLTQNQFDALCSFVYNNGSGNFLRSNLLRLINKNPNDPKISDEFMRWVYDEGKVRDGLVRRRNCECYLYFKGILKIF